jgi:hypothetical protein
LPAAVARVYDGGWELINRDSFEPVRELRELNREIPRTVPTGSWVTNNNDSACAGARKLSRPAVQR